MALPIQTESALERAIRAAGSQSALARLIGTRQSTVASWLVRKKALPPEHVLLVEAGTGISRHDLRPDIYPRDNAAADTQQVGARA
ncbi:MULTISPECIES: transcriptional regulator [unclassified Sphingomonas]|uniref:transcriptional regulator n=1 Tax=unclassified Sphingomonas TaxID=196159 RepID=UPI0009EC8286|nr:MULTISPECIES: YdaS family helix-turn-helix protein [unclassified Sphingomonas]